jgi:hypothetical protein
VPCTGRRRLHAMRTCAAPNMAPMKICVMAPKWLLIESARGVSPCSCGQAPECLKIRAKRSSNGQ